MFGNVTGAFRSVNQAASDHRSLLIWLLLWAVVRTLLVTGVDLGKDEAAYWYWSQHLDASYAWLPFVVIAVADAVWPGVDLILRLPFIAASVFSALLLHHLCRLRGLSSSRSALAVAAFATSHWIWHTGSFLHPDGMLVPAWLAVLVCSERATRGEDDRWWSVAGAAAGLAALSKYSGLVLAAGLFTWLLWLALHGRRRPLLRAGVVFVLCSSPLLFDLLSTGFLLPASLSTLSAVAPASMPLRLLLFVAAPLVYVSPVLLFILYRGAWSLRHQWRGSAHLWLPGVMLVGCFCFYALTRGQVKGNWILPAFLGLWPLAFATDDLRSRGVVVVLLVLGGSLAALPAVTLRWPGVAASLSRSALQPLNDSYTAIVSRRDLPREPTYSWTERVCEYHGWEAFGREVDEMIRRQNVRVPATIASSEYGLAFGIARYAHLVDAVALPGDPRFVRLAAAPEQATLHLARIGQQPPGVGARQDVIVRRSAGCEPMAYEVFAPPAGPAATGPATGPGKMGVGAVATGRESAATSRR
ncbi:MAG: glycosyltransferase family 39 protein [bacterium]|nr:glycosyltransferase family 39 protein [bacterium]